MGPRTSQLPPDWPRPDTDVVEMAPGLSHPYPVQLLTMGADLTLHDIRDEVKGDVPFDLCRLPGHQDRLFLCS